MRFRSAAVATALAAVATTGVISANQADAQNNTVELVRAEVRDAGAPADDGAR